MPIRRSLTNVARRAVGHTPLARPLHQAAEFLRPPRYPGMKLTRKRLLNLYRVRYDRMRGKTRLSGYPLVLTVESTNACNLRCPYCFTGAGEKGRETSMLQMPLYGKLLDELGDRLLNLEFYNWGEPLLNKNIYEMIGMATSRGISTYISTNFSIPFDAERAERLVASGLSLLGVSLDGATQESYEKYRVRGNLETILRNVRLVNDAKQKLGSSTPEMAWEFHIFEHNRHEIEQARSMAAELGMVYWVSKGWVAGADWDAQREFEPIFDGKIERCKFLWERAVVNNDGGVAPCCGTFYREDDFATIRGEPAVSLSSMEHTTFRKSWNNERFRDARAMFQEGYRANGGAGLVCAQCPVTVTWQEYRSHLAAGKPAAAYEAHFAMNDGFNYFFNRKPERSAEPGPQPLALVDGPEPRR